MKSYCNCGWKPSQSRGYMQQIRPIRDNAMEPQLLNIKRELGTRHTSGVVRRARRARPKMTPQKKIGLSNPQQPGTLHNQIRTVIHFWVQWMVKTRVSVLICYPGKSWVLRNYQQHHIIMSMVMWLATENVLSTWIVYLFTWTVYLFTWAVYLYMSCIFFYMSCIFVHMSCIFVYMSCIFLHGLYICKFVCLICDATTNRERKMSWGSMG